MPTAIVIDADHEPCQFCGRIIPKGFGAICPTCLNNACDLHGDSRAVIHARDARAKRMAYSLSESGGSST